MFLETTMIGNAGKDAEVKDLANDRKVASVSLATTKTWMKDGQPQEKTVWVEVVAYGKLAESFGAKIKKGMTLWVRGEPQAASWVKDGEVQQKLQIVLSEYRIVNSGKSKEE